MVPVVDDWVRRSERVWDSVHVRLQEPYGRYGLRTHWISENVSTLTINLVKGSSCPHMTSSSSYHAGSSALCMWVLSKNYVRWIELSAHYRISPSFYVSLLKLYTRHLVLVSTDPGLPPLLEIDGEPANMVRGPDVVPGELGRLRIRGEIVGSRQRHPDLPT